MKIDSESLFRQHGKWYGALRWKDDSGKWHRKTKACKGKTKALAKIELQEWRREVEAEQVASSTQTLGQLVEEWLEVERATGNVERSTISGYETISRRIASYPIANTPAAAISRTAAQAWVIELSEAGFSPVTIKKTVEIASRVVELAIASGALVANPFRGLRRPKLTSPRPNSLDVDGRARVQTWLVSGDLTRLRMAAALALHGGLRLGECCGLRWDDIEPEKRVLWVRHAIGYDNGKPYVKLPKTGHSRDVPLDDFLLDALERWRVIQHHEADRLHVEPSAYVLGTPDGYMLPNHISHGWAVISRELNLIGTEGKRVNFHGLRHTFATVAVASGVDIKTVSSILGHANAAMTLNVYASADPDAKRAAASVIGDALG